jgi:hypothetical protein
MAWVSRGFPRILGVFLHAGRGGLVAGQRLPVSGCGSSVAGGHPASHPDEHGAHFHAMRRHVGLWRTVRAVVWGAGIAAPALGVYSDCAETAWFLPRITFSQGPASIDSDAAVPFDGIG